MAAHFATAGAARASDAFRRALRRVWLPEGSPLRVHAEAQAAGLQARLGPAYRVILGMTYGNPSIGAALAQFQAEGIDRILVFPLYPQFSSTTTAPVYDAVNRAAGDGAARSVWSANGTTPRCASCRPTTPIPVISLPRRRSCAKP